ncbi:MAG: hypothetical protein RIQ79_745, partial [Verrucomicrobiota bacterium]
LAAAGWLTGPGAVPATAEQTAGGRAFAAAARTGRNDQTIAAGVWLHAPIRPSRFESPVAWLAVRYPESGDAAGDRAARRGGLAAAGGLALLCALGFVFACRQAEENEQLVALGRVEAASRAKTEFLAFLSHELRTPLQIILGRAGLLRRSADTETARQATAIEEQGRLMLRLVTDLLDLGTIEAGKLELRTETFSLRERLERVRTDLLPQAGAKGLRLEWSVAADVPDGLRGDEARLRQVAGNLLGNAIRYTPQGWVRFEVTSEAAEAGDTPARVRLALKVSDSGPGLPPAQIASLFTLFTRLDSGDTHRREGTGVGLALVRRLCELMGGEASASNRPEGGAEFRVRLVFARETSEPEPLVESAQPAGNTGTGTRVLVAEDNAAARAYLTEALVTLGCRVTAVADGDAAVTVCLRERPEVLVLDVNLPGKDGIEVARLLSRQAERPRIIGCSAEAFAETREAALAAGMDLFLEKPVTLEALAAALGRPEEGALAGNIFEHLNQPALLRRTRDLLQTEWPDWQAEVRAAAARNEADVIGRLAHRWLSHAALLHDETLAETLKALRTSAEAGAWSEIEARLSAVDTARQAAGG